MSELNCFGGRLSLIADAVRLLDRCDGGGLFLRGDVDHRALLGKINAPLLWEGDQA